jgi:hypothetical protein
MNRRELSVIHFWFMRAQPLLRSETAVAVALPFVAATQRVVRSTHLLVPGEPRHCPQPGNDQGMFRQPQLAVAAHHHK